MPQPKGKTGNPNGRPKGAKGKKTVEWENFGREVVEHGSARAKEIMDRANDRDFMFYFMNLVEYFQPKQSRQQIEATVTERVIKVERE